MDFTLNFEIIAAKESGVYLVRDKTLGESGQKYVCTQCNLEKVRQTLSEIVTSLRPGGNALQLGKASLTINLIRLQFSMSTERRWEGHP